MGEATQDIMKDNNGYRGTMLFQILGFLVFYITISPITIYSPSIFQIYAYILFIAILFSLKKQSVFDSSIRNIRSYVILCFTGAFILPIFIHGELPFVTDLFQWISLLLIISLKPFYRVEILKIALKWLYIVTLLSIIEYLIGYFTSNVIFIADIYKAETSYSQSFFNLYRAGDIHYRFTSLASEPGELGALCGFVIAFVPFKREYIKYLIVFSIAGIISLSLAFYIYLLFILVFRTILGQLHVKVLLLAIVLLSGAIIMFQDSFEKLILERVTGRSLEEVDNRTGERVNQFMSNLFTSPESLYGVGNRTAYNLEEGSGQGNAGLKWKLFQYGILGVGFYFIGMLILYRRLGNKHVPKTYGILFFLLYFYSVGWWGVPFFILLMFTTLPLTDVKKIRPHSISKKI